MTEYPKRGDLIQILDHDGRVLAQGIVTSNRRHPDDPTHRTVSLIADPTTRDDDCAEPPDPLS